jgi:flagellar hook protein FlgE
MSILSSLNTGVSGLKAQGEALGIYSDNIANANTVGFKTSRPEFQDVIARSLRGALGGNQIGRGAQLAGVNPVFSQGSITQTDSPTDLAITGDGFFVLDGKDGRSFTRNGSFHFNNEGKMTDANGNLVMGFEADDRGVITSKMAPISVNRTVVDAQGTKNVDLQMNLDMRADASLKFDPSNPDRTAHFATAVTVYDTGGAARTVTLYFNKTGDGDWTWRAMAKGEDIVKGKPGEMVEQAKGRLSFDSDGRLKSQKIDRSSFSFEGGAQARHEIRFNFGDDKSTGGDGLSVTQYGTDSEAYKTIQDGFTAGTLTGIAFGESGILLGNYSNGKSIALNQVALGRFENPEGLFKMGQNRFRQSAKSGEATVGAPELGGRGSINPQSIEQSTTDIAQEFINLMGAQRSFQANSRVINVADEMMSEVLKLVRI